MPAGTWGSNGNIYRGSALWNQGKQPNDHVSTEGYNAAGVINQTNGINRTEPFNEILENNSTYSKNQTSGAIAILDSDNWQEAKDVFIFAKLRATDVLNSIKVMTDAKFDASNFFLVNIYLADKASQEPILWDEKTITTNGLSITDDDSNNRTTFTFTTSDMVHAKDWYNDQTITVSGSSTIPAGTYTINNYTRNSGSTTVSFTLSSNPADISGSYVDIGASSTNQTATFTFVRNKGIRHIYSINTNSAADGAIPLNEDTGEIMSWNTIGRSCHSLGKELHEYNKDYTSRGSSTFLNRTADRLIKSDDICYLGCSFLRSPTFDGGETSARLGFSVDYGSHQ